MVAVGTGTVVAGRVGLVVTVGTGTAVAGRVGLLVGIGTGVAELGGVTVGLLQAVRRRSATRIMLLKGVFMLLVYRITEGGGKTLRWAAVKQTRALLSDQYLNM